MTIFDIYLVFRRAQGYRRPKDVVATVSRLTPDNQIYLDRAAKVFTQANIDPEAYFQCGFELYGKGFTYRRFFNDDIMRVYKEKLDARTKRLQNVVKSFKRSYDNVRPGMKGTKTVSPFLIYCTSEIDGQLAPVHHYHSGLICKYFITWLVYKGWLQHNDNPLEHEYREILGEIKETHVIPV